MKRLLIILLIICPSLVIGQTVSDVLNLSGTYYQGTAKSMAMGNAMGAVGQDFSAISINPAGLGLFRKPTFTFTPSLYTTYTKTNVNENIAHDSKVKLSINNFGYVGTNKSGKNTVNFAIGMNRTNNFNNSIFIDAYNANNSLVDAYIAEIIANDIYNERELSDYSPYYIYPMWETYLLNFENDGSISSPIPVGGLRQLKGVNSWGGTNEWTIASSVNFGDKIFFGVSINMPYIYSKKLTEYEEDFSTDNYSNYWIQEEALNTNGWGINGKIGLIAYPARWLRVGATFHSPTVYTLRDSWKTRTYADVEEYDIYSEFNTPTSSFVYTMYTYWKAGASAAFIFGNYGMITADYEYIDYGDTRLSAYDYDYSYLNHYLNWNLSPTMNLRFGTEWRYQNFCFRGGYSFYGSPYGISSKENRRNSVSCGIGYTIHYITIDLAYVYSRYQNNYNLYSQYTGYYNDVAPDLTVKEINNLHNVVMSFKIRLY